MYEAERLSDVVDDFTVTIDRTCLMLTTLFHSIDNSALSEVSSDRNDGASDKGTLSAFSEDVFFPLWTVWRNFKTCLMPKYKFPEYDEEEQYER